MEKEGEPNVMPLQDKLAWLNRECPFVPHTNAGRLFSTVRRMKLEEELEIPVPLRAGHAISVRTGKRAYDMDEGEWKEFYHELTGQLRDDYPELYERVFGSEPAADISVADGEK
jgi:hypothetical protein